MEAGVIERWPDLDAESAEFADGMHLVANKKGNQG